MEKTYEIQLSGQIHVVASSLEEAAIKFRLIEENIEALTPGIFIWPEKFYNEDLGTVEPVGICEICMLPVFDFQAHNIDSEGIITHDSH